MSWDVDWEDERPRDRPDDDPWHDDLWAPPQPNDVRWVRLSGKALAVLVVAAVVYAWLK